MMLSQPFPVELVLLTLSHLDVDVEVDRNALIVCGLVNKPFLIESRAILFHSVVFSTHKEWRVNSFFNLLEDPHCSITKHVKHVKCIGADPFSDPNPYIIIMEPRAWQANVLSRYITKLPHLTSLRLENIIMGECISPEVLSAFILNLKRSNITHLGLGLITFRRFDTLCEIIAAPPLLQVLDIQDASLSYLDIFPDIASLRKIVPTSKTLRKFFSCWTESEHPGLLHSPFPSLFSWMVLHPDAFSQVESMIIHIKSTRRTIYEQTNAFLAMVGQSLKSFEFLEYIASGDGTFDKSVSLARNTNLHKLIIPLPRATRPSLPAMLKTVSSPHFEEIQIVHVSLHPALTQVIAEERVLRELDEVLAQPNLKCLRNVTVSLGLNQPESLREAFRTFMPQTHERDVLQLL